MNSAASDHASDMCATHAAPCVVQQKSHLLPAILFFLFTRLVVVVVAFMAPQHRDRQQFPWWPANPLIRWDAGHYWGIMVRGYPTAINDTTAFFPLYSLTAWPVWKVIQGIDRAITGYDYSGLPETRRNVFSSELALVLTSHALSLAALIVFYRWCARLAGDQAALRACMLLSAFPTAMYFSVGYAEGLFVLCVALGLWWIVKERDWLACLACGAATATRPTGVVLAAVILLMILARELAKVGGAQQAGNTQQNPERKRAGHTPNSESAWMENASNRLLRGLARLAEIQEQRWLRLVALGLFSISGLLLHTAYLRYHYGRADAYFEAQKGWAPPPNQPRSLVNALLLQPVLEPTIRPIKYALRGEFAKLTDARNWNLLVSTTMVALAIVGFCRPRGLPRPAFLLTILVFLLAYQDDPFHGGRLLGIARYHLMGLPVFLWVATSRWIQGSLIGLTGLLLAMLVLQSFYVAGYVDWILVS